MKALLFVAVLANLYMLFLQRQYSFEIIVIAISAVFFAISIIDVAIKNEKLEKELKELKEKQQ